MHHSTRLIFVFFLNIETGFHHVSQADLKLRDSSDAAASASHSAGMRGVSHRTGRGCAFVCILLKLVFGFPAGLFDSLVV